jgi:hypothetical protein
MTAHNLLYLTILCHTLASTSFYINQYKTIQSPVICATLNKMGINRNASCHIVFGPKDMEGMVLW